MNGAELKTMLENGVSRMPAVDGRFPQVSGLCFTYDIALAAGSRVTSAVMADDAGNCTATPVNLTSGASYKIAQNDFTATGGDGYPNFASRMTTQDIMEQVEADYMTAHSPLAPVVKAAPERTDQLHGLERHRHARRTVRRWFRLRSDSGLGGPPRSAVGHPQPDRDERDEGRPAAERRPGPVATFVRRVQRGRVAEDAGDRERLSVGAARDAPAEDALDQLGMLLHAGRRLAARPVDAVVAPPVASRPRRPAPTPARPSRSRVAGTIARRPRKRLRYAAGEWTFW